MKKLTFIIALIVISNIAIGQNLIESNKLWTTVECFGGCYTVAHKFQGDTLINGLLYQKHWETTDSTFTVWYFDRAMRETPDGKVYQMSNQGEELLYDFGLEVNEQFITNFNGCDIILQVESTDSVTLLNGEKRKRINFVSEIETWVEGIGSSYGLMSVAAEQCYFDVFFGLNCFTENGILKYANPDFEDCFVVLTGTDEIAPEKIALFPNPFNSNLEMSFPFDEQARYQIEIKDLYGQIVSSQKNIYSGHVFIDGGNLSDGIYFLCLMEDNKIKLTKKIIKY